MALFGRGARDIKLFRSLNRELINDIITQQCAFYKYNIEKTTTNIYGESTGNNYFTGPILFNCLVERGDQEFPNEDYAIDSTQQIKFKFLKDDLRDANLVPEVGDVILYQESYYETDKVISNQHYAGKDPEYPNNTNPLNPGLEQYGWDVSIILETHLVSDNKISITNVR